MDDYFYKSAIEEAPVSYACSKLICDENNGLYDFEILSVNRSFADLFGLEVTELVGNRFSELLPSWYKQYSGLIETFRDIAVNGGQKELEQYFDFIGAWCRIKIFSPGKNYLILYLLDTSKNSELQDELGNLDSIFEQTGYEYKSMKEEKDVWERRLNAIADVLKMESDLQFQRIIENLPFSLNIVALNGVMLYANAKCLELFKLEGSAIGSETIFDLWVDSERRNLWIETIKCKGVVNDFEMHMRTAAGREFWSIGSSITIQYQEHSCILSAQLDITERKLMESALKISEEKYRLLTEFASDVIWILNLRREKFSYISPSIYYLSGHTPEEAMNLHPWECLTSESEIIVKEAIERDLREFLADPDNQKPYILEIRQKCKNGEIIWVEISSKYRFNEYGDVEIVGVSRNIEERKRTEREVLFLSYHDQLTGLYNRRFYEEELLRINFQRNMPMTLVLADVNGLKLTNDAFGHFAGDNLLKKFTAILNAELRAEDMAARIGGDEFVLLLPKTDAEGTELLINRIKDSINEDKSDNAILSVSFGWATKETVEEDFSSLFIQAEDRMYHKKLIESTIMKNETISLVLGKLFQTNAIEKRHSERVGRLCVEIGKAMNLNSGELCELELLGKMHDIGKIGIQDKILSKHKRLNETEWLEIKRHPEIGYQILRSADEYVHIAEAVLSHHERVDGKGYPRKLKSDEIPLQARILAVAEAYDIMTAGYSFDASGGEIAAVQELINNSGKQFDKKIVDIFLIVLNDEKAGKSKL